MRRALLAGLAFLAVAGLALLAGKGGSAGHQGADATPAAVTAYPLMSFKPGTPEQTRFGPLVYMGGLELRSPHPGFGGISGFRFRPDGETFLAVTDVGDWITGRVIRRNAIPTGLTEVMVSPVMTATGQRAKDIGLWDIESIALAGDRAVVGIERKHALLGFDFSKDSLKSRGFSIRLPDFVMQWPGNRGIEALGFLPQGSRYAGGLIGLSERSTDRGDLSEGFVVKQDGGEPFRFQIRRRDGFDVTDLDFMPNGDLMLLERFFSPLRGVGMRIRRIRTSTILPDAVLDPEILLTVDNSHAIDNMEGLSIHKGPAGETLLTIVSDNNFSIVQRNLLLQFRWVGE